MSNLDWKRLHEQHCSQGGLVECLSMDMICMSLDGLEVKFICCLLPPLNVYFTTKHTLLMVDQNIDPPLFAYISTIMKEHIPESSKCWTFD